MGGDDTLSVANELSLRGINVVGVPKTMDLDLAGTQVSVGFVSYVESVVSSLSGFKTTCASFSLIM
jgi:6-phosphofructokinase 1